jgi:hypothetical protein
MVGTGRLFYLFPRSDLLVRVIARLWDLFSRLSSGLLHLNTDHPLSRGYEGINMNAAT